MGDDFWGGNETRRRDESLKPYRSQAEKTAVQQRNVQIGLSCVILLVGIATLLASLGLLQ